MLDHVRDKSMPPGIRLGIHSAADLKKADLLGKSDPYCEVTWRSTGVGDTAVISSNLNPVWEDEYFNCNGSANGKCSG
jgi:Ca2+-dependent lipid-binding protein